MIAFTRYGEEFKISAEWTQNHSEILARYEKGRWIAEAGIIDFEEWFIKACYSIKF